MKMKSEKIIALAKGVWAFCSYLFVPQRRAKEDGAIPVDIVK